MLCFRVNNVTYKRADGWVIIYFTLAKGPTDFPPISVLVIIDLSVLPAIASNKSPRVKLNEKLLAKVILFKTTRNFIKDYPPSPLLNSMSPLALATIFSFNFFVLYQHYPHSSSATRVPCKMGPNWSIGQWFHVFIGLSVLREREKRKSKVAQDMFNRVLVVSIDRLILFSLVS